MRYGLIAALLSFASACSVPGSYLSADREEYGTVAALVSRYNAQLSPEDLRLMRANLVSWDARLRHAGSKP